MPNKPTTYPRPDAAKQQNHEMPKGYSCSGLNPNLRRRLDSKLDLLMGRVPKELK